MDISPKVDIIFILFLGTAAMLLLVGAVIFLFVVYHRRHLKAQQELYAKEAKHQEQLMFSNLQTLEDERKRFAEDLHDEIGASLSAIRLYVGNIENQVREEKVLLQLKEVKATIDQSMASTRRIAHNILPPGLEIMGLSQVVNDLVKQLNAAHTLRVTITVDPLLPKLEYQKELILYRVLQELFNNTLKHAKATAVNISFVSYQQEYQLTYQDNGIGFDIVNHPYSGIGLSNLSNRVRMLGGSSLVLTSPGNGFKAIIQVPVNRL